MIALASMTSWAWFVLAIVLIGLEVFLPGAFMIWLGLAAAVTGVVVLAVPMDWPYTLLLFAVLGLVLALVGRRAAARVDAQEKDQPFLNRRAEALVGQSFVLAEPISNGEGRIRVGDTVWQVCGHDAPAGARIRVVALDGGRLRVKPEDKPS